MTQCQYRVHHPGGFLGYYERCKRNGYYIEVTAPEGVSVSVCRGHQKLFEKRNALKMQTPLAWFVQTSPQVR